MIKHTYEPYGAQFLVTIAGETPAEVAQTVNRYCNHGMFTPQAIPTEYREDVHTRVTIGVTRARMIPTLAEMLKPDLIRAQASLPREKRFTGAAFEAEAIRLAENRFAEIFQRAESVAATQAAENGVADLRDYTLSADENTPWLRKAARRMLSGLATAKRDSAPRAAKSQAE